MSGDRTTDPSLGSWVPVPPASDFPIQNLPFGAFRAEDGATHLCVAIGDHALDLFALAHAGLLDGVAGANREVFAAAALGPLLRAGRPAWRATRERLSQLLTAGDEASTRAAARGALVERNSIDLVLSVDVPDYVDFFSSLEHATNLGKILRPGGEALLPNWRYVPIGYHGRTSTIVLDGSPVTRPRGQLKSGDSPPVYAPTASLDFELEMGFITGAGPEPPAGIAADAAREHIFGLVLLNDWSARDIQAWEYQPLGPFLAKSFATSLSPWIVTLDALEPFRVAGPSQEPAALPHLRTSVDESFDIALDVTLESEAMRRSGIPPQTLARTNLRAMYWSMAQQLAHASSNGARVRAGDLFGSGTISGSDPGSYGSMIELTWRGAKPFALADGTTRAFLNDGDEIAMHGRCEAPGRSGIGFGAVRGRILPAMSRGVEPSR
jgi:fumarylacetoacetase